MSGSRAGRGVELALQNASTYPELRGSGLRSWLGELLAELAPTARSCGVRFCGRRAMAGANRTYRGREGVTDVLSFPDGDVLPNGRRLLGQIVISLDAARRQAAHLGHSELRELQELVLHGTIHLLGYDHENDDGVMNELELPLRQELLG